MVQNRAAARSGCPRLGGRKPRSEIPDVYQGRARGLRGLSKGLRGKSQALGPRPKAFHITKVVGFELQFEGPAIIRGTEHHAGWNGFPKIGIGFMPCPARTAETER